jgi:hypothetical protein
VKIGLREHPHELLPGVLVDGDGDQFTIAVEDECPGGFLDMELLKDLAALVDRRIADSCRLSAVGRARAERSQRWGSAGVGERREG